MTLPVLRSRIPMVRWDPFVELEDLRERMNQMMPSFGMLESGGWSPLADLSETEDAYLVEVDLPGVKRDDIDIELDSNELAITGEFADTSHEGKFRNRTRRTGQFAYRTALPHDVDPEGITAHLADGVLTVRVPKSEAARPRHIEIAEGSEEAKPIETVPKMEREGTA